jgi:hypothetical protein
MKSSTRDSLALVLVAGLAVWLVWLATSCGNPYLTAYRSIATTRSVALATEGALGAACEEKVPRCLAANAIDSPGYVECMKACKAAMKAWRGTVRPAINSALVVAVGAVQVTEAAKSKPDTMTILKPVACALARALEQWGSLLPVSVRATAQAACAFVSAATCPKEVSP